MVLFGLCLASVRSHPSLASIAAAVFLQRRHLLLTQLDLFQPHSRSPHHYAQLPSSHPRISFLHRKRCRRHSLSLTVVVQSQSTQTTMAWRRTSIRHCSQTTHTQQQQHYQAIYITLLHYHPVPYSHHTTSQTPQANAATASHQPATTTASTTTSTSRSSECIRSVGE